MNEKIENLIKELANELQNQEAGMSNYFGNFRRSR